MNHGSKDKKNLLICLIGVGYVGLPLALAMSKKFEVIGYDTNTKRINSLRSGIDPNGDCEFHNNFTDTLDFTDDEKKIGRADVYIVTVPTPIDEFNAPDLNPLKNATELVSRYLKKGNHVIFESTVYPTTTQSVCIPILEEATNLEHSKDFFVGYSPERVNPGDKIHTIDKVVKVVSGCCPESLNFIENLYSEVIPAGVFRAVDIKTAEASKIVENIQRDVNIALVNELAIVFDKLNIKTKDVIEAAGTKWNFNRYMPGLVGGHCIGVDPYYWIHKANGLGVNSNLIIGARKINDSMANFVVERFVKMICQSDKPFNKLRILIAGITFKENCSDLRNSKVIDVINGLIDYGLYPDVFDPMVTRGEAILPSGIAMISVDEFTNRESYDAILLAVPHAGLLDLFDQRDEELLFDLKGATNFGGLTL
jgi:UDP-N-acetyl-D-galactosamine dehydrogenase|tara:strand:- start:1409 stop:2680 length:1272 start_codon:yes stop_codon:yes gene_type:complete